MSRLLEKLRKARESTVEAGGFTFTIRRPTDAEAASLQKEPEPYIAIVRKSVVGWSLKELDVIPGGGPEPAAFDPLLWSDWIDDHAELWVPIATAVIARVTEHNQKAEERAKN